MKIGSKGKAALAAGSVVALGIGSAVLLSGGSVLAQSSTVDTYTVSFTGAGESINHPVGSGYAATTKSAFCAEGDIATGGGHSFTSYGTPGEYSVWRSQPEMVSGQPGGWQIGVSTNDTTERVVSFDVYVVCIHKVS